MNTDKNPSGSDSEKKEPDTDDTIAVAEDCAPRTVRNARKMRKNLWPHLWLSFASIVILAAALAILTYRMGVQSCR